MSAADVPVCAGRGAQPRCKYYKANGSDPAIHWCTALYSPVTGEALLRRCEDVRGDQMTCGRHGALYEAVEAKPAAATSGRDVTRQVREALGITARERSTREDLG